MWKRKVFNTRRVSTIPRHKVDETGPVKQGRNWWTEQHQTSWRSSASESSLCLDVKLGFNWAKSLSEGCRTVGSFKVQANISRVPPVTKTSVSMLGYAYHSAMNPKRWSPTLRRAVVTYRTRRRSGSRSHRAVGPCWTCLASKTQMGSPTITLCMIHDQRFFKKRLWKRMDWDVSELILLNSNICYNSNM